MNINKFVFINLVLLTQLNLTAQILRSEVSKDLLFNRTTVKLLNGKIIEGLLFGTTNDTLYIHTKEATQQFAYSDLDSVIIEGATSNFSSIFKQIVITAYLGNVLLFSNRENYTGYMKDIPLLGVTLAQLLFVTIGGGAAILTETDYSERKNVFTFNRSNERLDEEISKITNFICEKDSETRKYHLNVYISQVITRYYYLKDKFKGYFGWQENKHAYDYEDITSLNLLRKFSFTFDINKDFEIGASICRFGEPGYSFVNYDKYNNIQQISEQYYGTGNYFQTNFKPFNSVMGTGSVVLGAGIGIGDINFSYIEENQSQEEMKIVKQKQINKMFFSGIFSAEFRYYIYPDLNLSLQTDYVYLPEKIPANHLISNKERQLGNFSFGIAFGLNF